MNIAITAGVQLMPPGFAAGLSAWSQENGLSGDLSWSGATNAAIVPADQDFGSCLEIVKQATTTKLRFRGETPILKGTYLRVSARVKAVAGNLPQVRIAGWAGTAAREHVTGIVEAAPAVPLTTYGKVVEVSAIVSPASRTGVTFAWGGSATLGHFGLDLIGANGGAVRIESIRIEDVTAEFLPTLIDWVDVRDYGAVGDGVTDDRAAFVRAGAAAEGAEILVPAGTYYIGDDLTINEPIRFTGKLKMPRAARLSLRRNFDFPTYADAFGDETEGMKRGLQALLDYSDNNIFDLCGRKVDLTEPLVLSQIVPDMTGFSSRRVIMNGQISCVNGPAFTTKLIQSAGTYDPDRPLELRAVAQVANIEVGSRISGSGVGREVYVRARNIGAGTLTLSQPLFGGPGTRTFTFTRYRYAFDFSGMAQVDRFYFMNVDFGLDGVASGVMMPPDGGLWAFRDCSFTKPRDRAITSIGTCCQGMLIDRCEFLSNESSVKAQDRTSIGLNVNNNDVKIRDNRFVRFAHFAVMSGGGHIITGNHWFQGDGLDGGLRTAGLVLTGRNVQTTLTGNYIDNATIEWTNEHHARPILAPGQQGFGGLTITGNTFLCSHVTPAFCWLVVKPYGANHYIEGLTVMGNAFNSIYGTVTRIERVDISYAPLDNTKMKNIRFEGNTFNGITYPTCNPATVFFSQNTEATKWVIPADTLLAFSGSALKVESIVAETPVTNASGGRVSEMPYAQGQQAANKKAVALNFATAVKGSVALRVRMDMPL